MPIKKRPQRKHTRLKKLREVAKLTQKELAEKIGVSTALIIRIENGTMAMSERVAERIMLLTGVDPLSLLNGPKLKRLGGDAFTYWHNPDPNRFLAVSTLDLKLFRSLKTLPSLAKSPLTEYYFNKLIREILTTMSETPGIPSKDVSYAEALLKNQVFEFGT